MTVPLVDFSFTMLRGFLPSSTRRIPSDSHFEIIDKENYPLPTRIENDKPKTVGSKHTKFESYGLLVKEKGASPAHGTLEYEFDRLLVKPPVVHNATHD